jgi:hypothetical protein
MNDVAAEAMQHARETLTAPLHKPSVTINVGETMGEAVAMMNRVRDETGICPICNRKAST